MYLKILALLLVTYVSAYPRRYQRHRRADEVKYAPCKNVYPQCPDWKQAGWCESPQYKDYMGQVCPVTCEFCRETTKEGTLEEVLPPQLKNEYIPNTQTAQSSQPSSQVAIQSQAAQANVAPSNQYVSQPTAPVASQATSQVASSYTSDTSAVPQVTDYQSQVQKYYESIQEQQSAYMASLHNYMPTGNSQSATAPAAYPTASASYNAAPTSTDQQYHTAQTAASQTQQQQAQSAPTAPQVQANQASTSQLSQEQSAKAGQPTLSAQNKTALTNIMLQLQHNTSKDTPEQTSSALYSSGKPKDAKPSSLKDTREKEGEPEEDATNEKTATESKHLEKSLVKIDNNKKEKKKVKKVSTIKKVKSVNAQLTHNTNTSFENEKPFSSFDDSEKDESIQGHEINEEGNENSARNSVSKETKEQPQDIKSSPQIKKVDSKKKKNSTGFHVEKSQSKVNPKQIKERKFIANTERSVEPKLKKNHAENENSLRHDFDDIDSDSDSDSESGSGNAGEMEEALSKDLEELSFLTGLNFDEDDYDVADDISNELLTIQSEKYAKNKRKARDSARSVISKKPKNDNLMVLNSNTADNTNKRNIVLDNEKQKEKTNLFQKKSSFSLATNVQKQKETPVQSLHSFNLENVKPEKKSSAPNAEQNPNIKDNKNTFVKHNTLISPINKNNIPHINNIPSIKKDTVENAVKKSIPGVSLNEKANIEMSQRVFPLHVKSSIPLEKKPDNVIKKDTVENAVQKSIPGITMIKKTDQYIPQKESPVHVKSNIPEEKKQANLIKKDAFENVVKKSNPGILLNENANSIAPKRESAINVRRTISVEKKSENNIVKDELISSPLGASHVRGEISRPEISTTHSVKLVANDETDAGSGESESGSGNSVTEDGSSGSDKADAENNKQTVKAVPQKTLLESMQQKGELKAYAVVKEVKKSTTAEKPGVKPVVKDSGATGYGSGSGESDHESGSPNTEHEHANEMENSGDLEETASQAGEDEPSLLRRDEDHEQPQDATKLASDFLPAELLPGVESNQDKKKKKKEKKRKQKSMKSKQETSSKPVLPPVSSKTSSKQEKEKEEKQTKEKEVKIKASSASNKLESEVLPSSQEERKEKEQLEFGSGKNPEGKLSLVLRQNFDNAYLNSKTSNYQMLAGNIKKDIETVLKNVKVKDISFSEATIEGNPRQTGKTRVTFNLEGSNHEIMQTLLKLVDDGNINGLAIVKSSLEIDDE